MRTSIQRGGFVLGLLLAILVLVPAVHAVDVVVFDTYNTVARIDGDKITIERDLRIKNVGRVPIIPGELHFRLHERRGDEKIPIPVSSFEAKSDRDESLSTRVSERGGETDLSVQLWNPLLPGFHYDFTMTYEMEFDPSGILFYEIKLPQEDTTIPIVNEDTVFELASGYHVTYAPSGEVSKLSGLTVVEWDNSQREKVIEYSRLPLPRTGMRAVNVFWIVVILALIAVFILSLRKTRGGKPIQQAPPQQQYYQQQQAPPQWQQQRGPPPQRRR